jgi:glycerol-3-phosphate dehydrogenase
LSAEVRAAYPWAPATLVARLVRAYGTRATRVLGRGASLDQLGPVFGADLTGAEVDYLMAAEWARRAEDVLWRRSKLGLRFGASEVAALESYMARARVAA